MIELIDDFDPWHFASFDRIELPFDRRRELDVDDIWEELANQRVDDFFE